MKIACRKASLAMSRSNTLSLVLLIGCPLTNVAAVFAIAAASACIE